MQVPLRDAGHGADPVSHQRFAHRFDDGHAAAHTGLVSQVHPVFGSRGDDRVAMLGQQGLVGGDHVLALVDGLKDHRFGDPLAADGFHDDIHLGIGDGRGRIRDHHPGCQAESPVRHCVDIGHIF